MKFKYKDNVEVLGWFYQWQVWILIKEENVLLWAEKWVDKWKYYYVVDIDWMFITIEKDNLIKVI